MNRLEAFEGYLCRYCNFIEKCASVDYFGIAVFWEKTSFSKGS